MNYDYNYDNYNENYKKQLMKILWKELRNLKKKLKNIEQILNNLIHFKEKIIVTLIIKIKSKINYKSKSYDMKNENPLKKI